MAEPTPEYVDMTPTPAGYAAYRHLFEESGESSQQEVQALDALLALVEQTAFGEQGQHSTFIHDMVRGWVEEERECLTHSLSSLNAGLAELTRGGY